MPVEQSDLVEVNEVKQGKDGIEAVRGFQVVGLSGNPDNRLLQAITEPGIPLRGEPHPSIEGIKADEISASPQGAENALVTVTYKQLTEDENEPDELQKPTITVGSTVQEDIVNLDAFGKQMLLNHTKRKVITTDIGSGTKTSNKDTKLPTQPGEVGVQFPLTTISLSRREKNNPLFKSEIYTGKINSAPIFGDPKHIWICTGIDGDSDDGGQTFTVSYNFQRAPQGTTWDPILVYIDPETDAPVAGLNIIDKQGPIKQGEADDSEVGIKRFQVYIDIDFNKLNIDFGFSSSGGGGAGIFISKSGFSKPTFPASIIKPAIAAAKQRK